MSNGDNGSKIYLDFIDPLFAFAVSAGFTEGIMQERWFVEWRLPQGNEWILLASFTLGLVTLVLSWAGYHRSIQSKPIKSDASGAPRFILDILIVLLYFLMLVKYDDLLWVIVFLVATYLLFMVWDYFKVTVEYKDSYPSTGKLVDRYPRELVTVSFFLLFTALLPLWILTPDFVGKQVTILSIAFALTLLYRIDKVTKVAVRVYGKPSP